DLSVGQSVQELGRCGRPPARRSRWFEVQPVARATEQLSGDDVGIEHSKGTWASGCDERASGRARSGPCAKLTKNRAAQPSRPLRGCPQGTVSEGAVTRRSERSLERRCAGHAPRASLPPCVAIHQVLLEFERRGAGGVSS